MLVRLDQLREDSQTGAQTAATTGAAIADRPGAMQQWILAGTIAGVLTYAITSVLDSLFKRR